MVTVSNADKDKHFKESNNPNILRCKCIVLGDSSVGKTSMIHIFNNDSSTFQKNYTMTCGIELTVKSVHVPDTNDLVELYIYDSSGKEIYLDMMQNLWKNPSVLVLVFDVTNEISFNSCSKWLKKFHSATSSKANAIPGILIGNKVDSKERRIISLKTAQEFAKKYSLQYFECSVKEHQGVDEAFFYLVNEWHKLFQEKTEFFKTIS
ncbi:intraflagellar transport protein 27 homolog isoform X1 [Centruroides sculpturatus]|uniref:intraflagellar transport protein 27 homolog isoform X1 n=1 Tax=Centruroides sculpturatus TaxID=218467 RepID=UPI000C6E4C79|nr:intraflagellar transport protein 27 homolog isoform X1 [Centruroides sculpturatus]